MSDFTADDLNTLNIRDVLARIDLQQAETRKFAAEQAKLSAEASKLNRDRSLAPWQFVAALMGAGALMFSAGAAFWKVVGG